MLHQLKVDRVLEGFLSCCFHDDDDEDDDDHATSDFEEFLQIIMTIEFLE